MANERVAGLGGPRLPRSFRRGGRWGPGVHKECIYASLALFGCPICSSSAITSPPNGSHTLRGASGLLGVGFWTPTGCRARRDAQPMFGRDLGLLRRMRE